MAPDKWLFWWKSPDGSKLLSFFYNKLPGFSVDLPIDYISTSLADYIKENGLKDFLVFYGVGDHGGGPTRQMIMKALEANSWPIFPAYKLSTMDDYYSSVEAQDLNHLFVLDDEINFVFDGCWTSESSIKHANRVSENIIPEVEALSLIAGRLSDFQYPSEKLEKAWRMAMFNQFHDILPGSGIHATYRRAEGQFQEIQSITEMIRARALKQLARKIDTSKTFGIELPSGDQGSGVGPGIGGGAGDLGTMGGVSAWGAGSVAGDPFLIYNQMPFARSEMVAARVWNKEIPHDMITVRGSDGSSVAGQVIETGNYWLYHNYITVLFPADNVPGMGYKTYIIERDPTPKKPEGVSFTSPSMMENEYLKVEFDMNSGGIVHLIDKATGYDYVPDGEMMGILEYCHEATNPMSSWTIGPLMSVTKLIDEGKLIDRWQGFDLPCDGGLPFSFGRTENPFPPTDYSQKGPYRCSTKFGRDVKGSRIWVEVGLNAGSRMVDFRVIADWREIGTPALGVPMLRMAFPIQISDSKGTYEIPFGSIERKPDGREVPALKWADLSGEKINADGQCGITMVNADKYGHNADGNTLRLTLIRSSFNPDPVPEVKRHDIRFAIIAHDGLCDVSDAINEGAAFNLPMSILSTDIHTGDLPGEMGFVEELTPNIKVAAVKKAEDSDAVIIRLFESDGIDTEGEVRISNLAVTNASAQEVDIIECPLPASSAKMDGDILKVKLPAQGIVTVKIG
jgi:alpha-mannosidase